MFDGAHRKVLVWTINVKMCGSYTGSFVPRAVAQGAEVGAGYRPVVHDNGRRKVCHRLDQAAVDRAVGSASAVIATVRVEKSSRNRGSASTSR